MIKRKLVIYQKGTSKPIVLSDTSDTLDSKLKEELKQLFTDDKISVLDTDDDFLILRPSDISAILVSKEKEEKPQPIEEVIDESDPEKGISQTDLYQMLAYAVRFKIDEIILFYPNTINNYQEAGSQILIEDALADDKEVQINSYQLPVLNRELLESKFDLNFDLTEAFGEVRIALKQALKNILLGD